jgi:hypothetical protein
VLVVALLSGFSLGAAQAPGAGVLDRPGVIRVTDLEVKHSNVDVGKGGRSPGDLDVYKVLLYNKRITQKAIGHGETICTNTGNTTLSCNATYFLPKGKIVASGVIGSKLLYELAVIGGTGLYNNARGTLTVTSLNRSPTRELLVFRLVV